MLNPHGPAELAGRVRITAPLRLLPALNEERVFMQVSSSIADFLTNLLQLLSDRLILGVYGSQNLIPGVDLTTGMKKVIVTVTNLSRLL